MTALLPVLTVILGLIAAERGWPIAPVIVACLLVRRPGLALVLAVAWIQGAGYCWTIETRDWELPLWADRLQGHAVQLLGQGLPYIDARLLGGMLLGRTAAGFTLSDYPAWTDAGMAHLLVASGAQVTLLVFPLVWVLHHSDLAPRFRRWLAILILMQIGVVLLLTGLDPSILRAATLAAWLLCGIALGRPVLPLHGLARVAAMWLLLDPSLLTSASFQLSYAATFGLVTLTPLLDARIPERIPPLLRNLLLLCGATFAAQIAVTPVIWCRFERLELIGLVTNLIAVPMAEALIWFGIIKAALISWTPFGGLLNIPIALILRLLNAVADWGASTPTPYPGPLSESAAIAWLIGVALVPTLIHSFSKSTSEHGASPTPKWQIHRREPASEPA